MGLFRKKTGPEEAPVAEPEETAGADPSGTDASGPGRRKRRPGRKRDRQGGPPEAVPDEAGPEGAPADVPPEEDPEQAAAPVEEADYYDWKARYRPWAGADMMGPVLAGACLLGLLVLVLLYFVFHPIW